MYAKDLYNHPECNGGWWYRGYIDYLFEVCDRLVQRCRGNQCNYQHYNANQDK